jgi:hypothetical protein
MNPFRRKPTEEAPQRDPAIVAIACRTRAGWDLMTVRSGAAALELVATERFAADDARASQWIDGQRAGHTVVALPGADVIVRAVQLPSADEGRLESALQLNDTTFVLGRTPFWRVASALLPRERGDGIRTGLVTEWPEDAERPHLPAGIHEGRNTSFAPAVAGLAALSAWTEGTLVSVDAANGVLSICVPTSQGLLIRTVRAGGAGESIEPSDVAQAVGEACVHASVPAAEIPAAIAGAVQSASSVLGGGFGCSSADLRRLSQMLTGVTASDASGWWREHGLAIGLAAAATGPMLALTRLQSTDLGARPDRTSVFINRLSEPRTARRVLIAGVLCFVLGPLVIEGARLLLLRWKLPDLEAYQRAEDTDRKKQAMYRVLGRQGASMTKTLSDIACCAPDGAEIEFINVAQSAKGQSVTLRGKARPAGGQQSSEVMIAMERQLRESGAFESIQRSSEAPDSRGYQEFTLNATAVRPTYPVSFPESQDFARKSMRVRRYGQPPADVDPVASGLNPKDIEASKAGGAKATQEDGAEAGTSDSDEATVAHAGDASAGASQSGAAARGAASTEASKSADSTKSAESTGTRGTTSTTLKGAETKAPSARVADAKTADSKGAGDTSADDKVADSKVADSKGADGKSSETKTSDSKTAEAKTDDAKSGDAKGEDSKAAARAARSSGSGRGALATRSKPGGSSEPEPAPTPLSANEINQMSKEEARAALVLVSKARNRADLADDVQARLKEEFNLLLERCKRD